jgi:hypothetical protein
MHEMNKARLTLVEKYGENAEPQPAPVNRGPYRIRYGVPIPRLMMRGEQKPARLIDDPLYSMMLDMRIGESFVAPISEKGKIGAYIQAIRGRDKNAMFITRRMPRVYGGVVRYKIGVWRV